METWTREHRFQAGVQILENLATAEDALRCYSDLADIGVAEVLRMAVAETEDRLGGIEGGRCAVLALGSLGASELSPDQELDIVLVADYRSGGGASDSDSREQGARFYSRVARRLYSTLERQSGADALYRIRERSSNDLGGASAMITLPALLASLSATRSARDMLELVRARVVCGDARVGDAVSQAIEDAIARGADPSRLAADVLEARDMDPELAPGDPFGLVQGRGGLLDLRLLAQYLVVRYAHQLPETISGDTLACFEALAAAGVLAADELRVLAGATRMLRAIGAMLSLTSDGGVTVHEAPAALREKLAVALRFESPEALEKGYGSARERVFGIFQSRVGLKVG